MYIFFIADFFIAKRKYGVTFVKISLTKHQPFGVLSHFEFLFINYKKFLKFFTFDCQIIKNESTLSLTCRENKFNFIKFYMTL